MHHVTGNKMDVRSVFWGRLFFTFHPGSQSHPGRRHTIAHKWAKTNTSEVPTLECSKLKHYCGSSPAAMRLTIMEKFTMEV